MSSEKMQQSSAQRVLPNFRLDGKVVLITGASSGIGNDFALTVAEAGARVVVGARRKQKLDDLVNTINQRCGETRAIALSLDVRNVQSCKFFVEGAWKAFPCLQTNQDLAVLVNCAGYVANTRNM